MKKSLLFIVAAFAAVGQVAVSSAQELARMWSIESGGQSWIIPEANAVLVANASGTIDRYRFDSSPKKVGHVVSVTGGFKSKPIIDGTILFSVSADNRIGAYDLLNGKTIWHQPIQGDQFSEIAKADNEIVVGSANGNAGAVSAFEALSGTMLFSQSVPGYVFSRPTIEENAIFAGTSNGKIVQLDRYSGALNNVIVTNGIFMGQDLPVLAGRLLLAPSGNEQIIGAMAAGSAEKAWQIPFSHKEYIDVTETIGLQRMRPSGRSYAVGALQKLHGLEKEFTATGPIHTSSWVIDGNQGSIVVEELGIPPESRFSVLAVDLITGSVISKFSKVRKGSPAISLVAPVLTDSFTIACLGTGEIDGISRSTGKCAWSIETGDNISDMQLSGNHLTTVTGAGKVTLYRVGPIIRPVPTEFALLRNMPNPFQSATAIRYNIPVQCLVRIVIHDPSGRIVTTLEKSRRIPGYYQAVWDGKNAMGRKIAPGTYFATMRAGTFTKTIQMMLVK